MTYYHNALEKHAEENFDNDEETLEEEEKKFFNPNDEDEIASEDNPEPEYEDIPLPEEEEIGSDGE